MLLNSVVKSPLINEEITRPVFLLWGNNKACIFFLRRSIFQFTKKPEGRHQHQNSHYQFQIAFETDQNCSADRALPSGFLNYWLVFLCKFRMGGVCLFIEVVFFVKSSSTRPVFLLRGNNKARILFLWVFYDEVVFNFVVNSLLVYEKIIRSVFLLQGNNKARVLFLRVFYDEVVFHFVIKSSLVYEEITRPVSFFTSVLRGRYENPYNPNPKLLKLHHSISSF